MRIKWTEKASRELNEILVWIAEEKVGNAIAVSKRIDECAFLLGSMAYLGRERLVKGLRELVVPRTGYILVYRIVSESIEITGIRRGARRR